MTGPKKQTALRELILFLKQKEEEFPYKKSGDRDSYSQYREGISDAIDWAITQAECLLVKEKSQIYEAYDQGVDDSGYPKPLPQTGWIYFNETYITQDK